MSDTIFAVSSGVGRAGVAVVRVSGPESAAALLALIGAPLPAPRVASVRSLRDPETGERLDQVLALWFPGSASFTGEATAELHLHGGRAVVGAALGLLAARPGLRPAEAGEFTRRAFENGKLDLSQAEALGDLILADTAAQRRQALAGMEGGVGRIVSSWRQQLLTVRALIAADIDFSDEGDVPDAAAGQTDSLLKRLRADMQAVLDSSRRGRLVADGLRVAIVGRPNSGKSTLLNALCGSDAAIVTEHPGTTRDVIEVTVDWDGYPVILLDTAGLRETGDVIERIGIARGLERASAADVVLHVDPFSDWSGWRPALAQRTIRVRTKCDLGTEVPALDTLIVSAKTGFGLDALRSEVTAEFGQLPPHHDGVVMANERQASALRRGLEACDRALAVLAHAELLDHEVRAIERALESLVGLSGVEEVLGAVFSRFCVGK